jgi:hypothetical protein
MRISKAALVYFLQVFGAGFALACLRIPFLVPRFGVRAAELMEAPLMLAVIVWASRRLTRAHPDLRPSHRLAAGVLAFVLLVSTELAFAYLLGAGSMRDYVAARDLISGSVYLASLVFFAGAPALWSFKPVA